MNRRDFLKKAGVVAAGAGALSGVKPALAAHHKKEADPNAVGVLVDTTLCIGCRTCERACNKVNKLGQPDDSFEDTKVLDKYRYFAPDRFTVVNKFYDPASKQPVFVKTQCMHCIFPACASACIVGALRKEKNGDVSYDASKCIGCRYCMMACPFQVPANEFNKPIEPRIRKCTLCMDRIKKGGTPACADACPTGVMTFGKRADLIPLAHERILRNPGKYADHVYGEADAGGTSWMYLGAAPMTKLGLPDIGDDSPALMSETLMHAAFKNWIPPLAIFSVLGACMLLFKPEDGEHK